MILEFWEGHMDMSPIWLHHIILHHFPHSELHEMRIYGYAPCETKPHLAIGVLTPPVIHVWSSAFKWDRRFLETDHFPSSSSMVRGCSSPLSGIQKGRGSSPLDPRGFSVLTPWLESTLRDFESAEFAMASPQVQSPGGSAWAGQWVEIPVVSHHYPIIISLYPINPVFLGESHINLIDLR